MGKNPKRLLSNKEIIIIKIATACMLFLASSMFFFSNLRHPNETAWFEFREALSSWHPMLLIFFLGNILVGAYIILVMIKLWDKDFTHADKFDLPYRIVFSITLIVMITWSFFNYPYTIMPLGVMMLAILSGVLMWATPKIVDNDNEEF